METFSALLALCAGNSPVTGDFPAQRPVTRSFDVFIDLCLNKRLSKQSWGWWFDAPSRAIWRHCNEARKRSVLDMGLYDIYVVFLWVETQIFCDGYILSLRRQTQEIMHQHRYPFSTADGLFWNNRILMICQIDVPTHDITHIRELTHWGRDKMASVIQTIFADAFPWLKRFVFWLKFHWSLFQLTITGHWFS